MLNDACVLDNVFDVFGVVFWSPRLCPL